MGERSDDDSLLAQAEIAPLTGLAESLGIERNKWIKTAAEPLPETLRLTMNHYDMDWTREQLLAMGATPLSWSIGNEAYQLPFARGQAPRDGTREILTLLHDTGRVTRQEAASMLPILVLDPQPNELLLDLCAAPGSKATHAAERMAPSGAVVANEPISGRVNMLASNRGRLSLHNMMITKHDGRHVGRIPTPGFDTIVADVPCTGSATSRKNKDVWWSWSPKGGRTMFQLQVDIASRGAQLLRPGGTMVYSTCSIDPVENEAVITELIRKCPWMEIIEIDESKVNGLIWHHGLTTWSPLDEQGKVSENPQDVPFFDERFLPPKEQEMLEALTMTRRLYPQDNNTGGFFVALLQHREDATPQGVAKTFIDKLAKRREDSGWESRLLDAPQPNRHTVHGASEEEAAIIMQQCQLTDADYSWWKRGKRMAVAPKLIHERIWSQETPNKRGDRWPGGTFHPLQVIHVGLPAFVSKNENWRARQESIPLLYSQLSDKLPIIETDVLMQLLKDEALEPDVIFPDSVPPQGAFLLRCQHETGSLIINAWCGTRITLMLDKGERRLLSIRLNLEEEE